ncbi:MAG TPA: polysaccharide deacetylase family protein [Longimicrobiales bacterium]
MRIVPILMYHSVGEPPAGTSWPVLYVRPAAFRRQVRLLRGLGYRLVGIGEAMPVLRGERSERVAVITFDDAYADVYEHALPALLDAGARATTYAVSARVGAHNAWDEEKVGARKLLMDATQLREWRRLGMEVGAHTRTHPRLPELAAHEQQAEIAGSKAELEQLLGEPVDQFCYPYGELDERVVATVAQAGFAGATTTRRGRARSGDDLLRLRRVSVKGHLPLWLFPFRVVTGYEDRRGRG